MGILIIGLDELGVDLPTVGLLYYMKEAHSAATHIGNKMKQISKTTKTFKLFTALQEGEKITAAQASSRFGIKNMSAEVSRIRQAGYAVYANTRTAGNHVEVTEYEIGKPSRKLVAAGYLAMRLGLVA